jgi:hypothetical protein
MVNEERANQAPDLGWNRVGLGGLEPPTSSLSGKRSNRLSYRPSSVPLDHTGTPG